MNCTFNHYGRCSILTETNCSKDCKFRKTEEQVANSQAQADELLESKNLERVIIHTDDGPKVTVRRKEEW